MAGYNPFLATETVGGHKGGGRFFEDIATVENIMWQSRPGDIVADEEAFATALTNAFADGVETLEACATALNAQRLATSAAAPWTAERLRDHLAYISRASR